MDLLFKLWGMLPQLVDAITYIISGATMIAVLTPTPKDDNFLAKVRGWIDVLAGNIGHNK